MGCPVAVHCRNCNEPLDVYQPFEERFCCEECEQETLNVGDRTDPSHSQPVA